MSRPNQRLVKKKKKDNQIRKENKHVLRESKINVWNETKLDWQLQLNIIIIIINNNLISLLYIHICTISYFFLLFFCCGEKLRKKGKNMKKKELEMSVFYLETTADKPKKRERENYDPCIRISIRYLHYWAIVRFESRSCSRSRITTKYRLYQCGNTSSSPV